MGVGLDKEYTADAPNQYTALKRPADHDLTDLIRPHPEFDVVPANIDMFTLEQELVSAMKGENECHNFSTILAAMISYL